MKLLAPNVGWALSMRRLMWTSDGGSSWKDITPPAARQEAISSVFFLNKNRGWVLLAHGEPDIPGGTTFELASTDNAGDTWAPLPVTVPGGTGILHAGILAFSDSVHGWLALRAGVSAAHQSAGELLSTDNGGRNWTVAANSGKGNYNFGPMMMVTPQFGWLVGAGDSSPLQVTHDGGITWQTVELPSPVKTDQIVNFDKGYQQFLSEYRGSISPRLAHAMQPPEQPTYAAYDLPVFKDSRHGYVSVTYPGVVALFATDNGGLTWKPNRVLTGFEERRVGVKVESSMANSIWITAVTREKSLPHLRELESGASITDPKMPAPEESGILQMSFVSPNQGWVLTDETRLLSTKDGGATWSDISPPR